MKQVDKIKNLENLSYFNRSTISQYIDIKPESLSEDINRWIRNGILIQLKKGLYVTSGYYEKNQDKNNYIEFIANKIRIPSYLSLEYVLQKYSVLSESVFALTSITHKSGRSYRNDLGYFIYRNVKDDLFTGFEILEKEGYQIKEATMAKALFDWLYLKLLRTKEINLEILESFRLNLDMFKKKDFKEFKNYCYITNIRKFSRLAEFINKI